MNDTSRRHTLSNQVAQLGTPGQASGVSRMSLDVRRRALVSSASKARSESKQLVSTLSSMQKAMASMRSDAGAGADNDMSMSFAENMVNMGVGGDADSSTDTVGVDMDMVVSSPATSIAVEVERHKQEPEKLQELSLHELLTAAQISEGPSLANQPYGLLAALLQLQKDECPTRRKLMDQLAECMLDSVREAVMQAREVPACVNALESTWSNGATDATHEHVSCLQKVPTTVTGSPGPANAPDNLLISLGKQCRQIAGKRWAAWEGELMHSATSAMQQMTSDLRDRRMEVLREAAAIRGCISKPESEEENVQAQNEQLLHNQERIQQARLDIEKTKLDTEKLADSTSSILEQRKETLVRLARDFSHADANDQHRERCLKEHQKELSQEYAGLHQVQHAIAIIDRLSYFHTVRYQVNAIEVEVALTNKVRASVVFRLDVCDKCLVIDNVEVEAVKYGDVVSGADSTSELALAFFTQVLCSNAQNGPLSDGALAQIDACTEIPPLLQSVSGYIFCLRQMLQELHTFECDGYAWSLASDNQISIVFPGSKYMLLLPWTSVMHGGVNAVQSDALRSTASDGLEVVAEYPMKAVISSLRMRYGVQERGHFQGFPARAIRREVEAIVKHLL